MRFHSAEGPNDGCVRDRDVEGRGFLCSVFCLIFVTAKNNGEGDTDDVPTYDVTAIGLLCLLLLAACCSRLHKHCRANINLAVQPNANH